MKLHRLFLLSFFGFIQLLCYSQIDSTAVRLNRFELLVNKVNQLQFTDSLKKAELQLNYNRLPPNEIFEKKRILSELKTIDYKDSITRANLIARAKYIKLKAVGYPVTLMTDTLFKIYTGIGATTPKERSLNISNRIKRLYDDDLFKPDSLITIRSENSFDIIYGDLIIASLSEPEALINNSTIEVLAKDYAAKIKDVITAQKDKNSILKLLLRIGMIILVIAGIGSLIWLIGKGHIRTVVYISKRKDKWLKSLVYKDYTFLTADQELKLIFIILKLARWFFILVLLYLVLPLIFSVFPFSRGWASLLFGLVWGPLKGIFISIWEFLPKLFSILVIYFVMKYVIRFFKYVFSEIESEHLKLSGFHADWAKPTYGIVRFILYAFTFVLIFPYLPGSNSQVFKGVSVFLGVLFSLGSSSAIANMVAGLVITYMRPFKIGDRIKIGETTGDVIEKNMLVTRLRTIKNEEITIPNSAVLSGNTINYTSISQSNGLIIHSTVTIGYDVQWKDMHRALIDAALRTDLILKDPEPFVLQTSLDDFYVSYQINGYTHEPARQASIYSKLHENIQDVCSERGIEILSPHYRAARDGNATAIPPGYLPADYVAPGFNIKLDNNAKKE